MHFARPTASSNFVWFLIALCVLSHVKGLTATETDSVEAQVYRRSPQAQSGLQGRNWTASYPSVKSSKAASRNGKNATATHIPSISTKGNNFTVAKQPPKSPTPKRISGTRVLPPSGSKTVVNRPQNSTHTHPLNVPRPKSFATDQGKNAAKTHPKVFVASAHAKNATNTRSSFTPHSKGVPVPSHGKNGAQTHALAGPRPKAFSAPTHGKNATRTLPKGQFIPTYGKNATRLIRLPKSISIQGKNPTITFQQGNNATVMHPLVKINRTQSINGSRFIRRASKKDADTTGSSTPSAKSSKPSSYLKSSPVKQASKDHTAVNKFAQDKYWVDRPKKTEVYGPPKSYYVN